MFIAKRRKPPETQKISKELPFSFGGFESGKENCVICGGFCGNAGEFEEVDVGVNVKKIDGGFNDSLFFESDDGLYCYSEGDLFRVEGPVSKFSSSAYYREQFFVTDGRYVYEANCELSEQQQGRVYAHRLAASRDRVWGVYLNKLYFSSSGDANDWSVKGCNVDLPERCIGLAYLDEKIYVFGKNVYAVTPDSENTELKIDCVAQNVGDVNADTVLPVGNKIVFVANGKLCSLSKGKLTVEERLPFFEYVPVSCAAYGGKYCLIFKRRDGQNGGFLAEYDVFDLRLQSIVSRGFNSVCRVMSGVYACDGGKLYRLTDVPAPFFHSEKISCGKNAYLYGLSVKTRFPLNVAVRSGSVEQKFYLSGSEETQYLRAFAKAENVTLEFSSDGGPVCAGNVVLDILKERRD